MKFKSLLITGLLFVIVSTMSAQNYKTAIGVRTGFFNGFTIKNFVSENNAFEGIVNFRWGGTALTGLYEWQSQVPNSPGFDYFVGAGAHIGLFNNYKWDKDASVILGVDLMLGFEYTFPTAPFTLALDYKPAFNFIGDDHIWADGIGLSFRFNIR